MTDRRIMLITGTSRGVGRYLVEHYLGQSYIVIGVSRSEATIEHELYIHTCLDITDEEAVVRLFMDINRRFNRLDVLLNNAGVASMNHFLLTPLETARKIVETNYLGTFLLCREAAKLMQVHRSGRIVNFTSVAVPIKLAGEAAYAASKAAVKTLTEVLAYELGEFGITVNAVGPTPLPTDLIRSVPKKKIDALIARQAILRPGELRDVLNVVDFFVRPESDFITGQSLYLGGF